MTEFQPFPKIPRLSRECVITEKIDGTNASVTIVHTEEFPTLRTNLTKPGPVARVGDFSIFAGSRMRLIYPEGVGPKGCDNFGFAAWVRDNAERLVNLGAGTHYGEWWGKGIQRGYGLEVRRFSLFNTSRWSPSHGEFPPGAELANGTVAAPECCDVVPVLYQGKFLTTQVEMEIGKLVEYGSEAALGFMKPEGIIIYHAAARQYFKKTIEKDYARKGDV